MSYTSCMCLNCSSFLTVAADRTSEVENIACPTCGKKRMVVLQTEGVFSGGG